MDTPFISLGFAPPDYASQHDLTTSLQSTRESTEDLYSHPHQSGSSVGDSAAATVIISQPSDGVRFPADNNTDAATISRTSYQRSSGYSSSGPDGDPPVFPSPRRYYPIPIAATANSARAQSEPVSYVPNTILTSHLTDHSDENQTYGSTQSLRLNPSNYVYLSRRSTAAHKRFLSRSTWITGKFTVNPYLHIPAALLSPVGYGRDGDGERKNLMLEVENGGMDVDIFLVGDPGKHLEGRTGRISNSLRATLDLRLKWTGDENTFPLIAKIHTPTILRCPFHLTISGLMGYHALHLPSSFHGLLTITISVGDLDTHISLSTGFKDISAILSETGTARSYFVGELGGWARDKQGWEGDRVDVEISEGLVRIQMAEEKDADVFRRLWWKVPRMLRL